MRRLRQLLTVIGCLAWAAAALSSPLQVEATSAWGGWSRPGRTTEVGLRLTSPSRTTAQVTITSGGQEVHSSVNLEPGEPLSLSVPVRASERVTARIAPDGVGRPQADVALALSEAPLLAWAAPALSPQTVAGFNVVPFDADALPHNAAAYSSIDALVVDRAVVDALDADQLAALLSFMAGCGRTVLVSEDDTGGAAMLQGAVGCSRRAFAAANSAATALEGLARVLDSPQAEPPAATTLRALGGRGLEVWHLAVAVLAVCLAAIALAGVFSATLAAAIIVPALASAGALVLLQSRAADTELMVWAETRSNDGLAQYRALQHLSSPRRGSIEMQVMPVLTEPQACNAGEHSVWSWDAQARRFVSTRIAARLFATASLCYSGAFPVTRAALARTEAAGRLALSNPGPATWPEGTLVWEGRLQPLPPLAASGKLRLRADQGTAPVSAATRQAVARTPIGAAAVLWPLDLRVVRTAPTTSHAWLLLQLAPAG